MMLIKDRNHETIGRTISLLRTLIIIYVISERIIARWNVFININNNRSIEWFKKTPPEEHSYREL